MLEEKWEEPTEVTENLEFVQGTFTRDQLREALLRGETITVTQQEGLVAEVLEVPKGELGAFGDWERVLINVGDEFSVPVLRQTHHNILENEGNCAQYSSLNAARILHELNFPLHPAVTQYFERNPDMNPNTVEFDLTLELIMSSQEEHDTEINLTDARREQLAQELIDKANNPLLSLSNENAILLMHHIVNPEASLRPLIRNRNDINQEESFGAYLLALHGNHQQILLKLGRAGWLIDTLQPQVVTTYPIETALQNISIGIERGSIPWAYFVPVQKIPER